MIDEAGHGQFKANTTTHMLAAPMTSGLASYMFDVICPAIQALPEFLAETGYADVTDGTKTSFQKAFHTDLTHFAWLGQRPEYLASWQQTQTALGSSEWLTGFELFEKEALGTEDDVERVFFVDVGGGHGHQCLAVRDKYPGFKGQFVLEELPEVVQQLSEIPGLRIEVNDIFEEQKIKGKCVQILQNLKSAMAHDSRILVDEILLPETNVPYLGAAADLTMMIMQGSKERTRKQWTMLAERSGLRIAHVHEYNDSIGLQAIIVFELDQV
ncbi:S-adenosyl-L-methionine-dependent methyltransferase [Aspergillus undulatus]|uniref:S-adenosyl-L-methionine-dependent methyltransferase n=1 Tax=Aspergillus undulatus TaxID=1810928 RepID=UPI003CCD9CEA